MDNVEGVWTCVSSTSFGAPTHKRVIDSFKLELTSTIYRIFREGRLLYEGTYTLDNTSDPKSITITPLKREDTLFTVSGLYELDGDTLTLCLTPGGGERPKALVSTFDTSTDLKIWKRVPSVL